MSIFFDEDKTLTPDSNTSIAKGERTNFMENASSAFTAFRRSEMFTSERNNLEEEYINIVNILQKAGHTDIVSPLEQEFNPFVGTGIDVSEESFFKPKEELEANFWNKVSELQNTDENLKLLLSEAGLNTPDNMQATIAKKAHSAWKEFSDINERATTKGKIGGFGGIAAGAFTDPIMGGAAVASFGYSVPATIGAAALRVAYMEAIIGGVSETLIQLKAQPYRKQLGFEDAGLETGLQNIAMVTGASAALSPAFLGLFKAFGKGIDVGKKLLSKTSVEDLQKIHKELGDINPKFKDKPLNDIEIPKKDIPDTNTPIARTEHNERLNTATKQLQDGEPVDLPRIENKIIYHGTDKYFKDFDLNKTADQSIWFTDDIDAIKAGTVGAAGKGNIIKRIIDENKIKLATAEQADKYVDQQLIAMGYDGVKFSKAEGYTETNYRIFNTEKLDKTGSVQSSSGFNKNETKLAEDIEGVKNYDVPDEATLRNQALDLERSMFDVGTSAAIKDVAGAGSAAKTVPTDNPLAKTQDLVSKSQRTDAAPSSTVLATAQSKPPLIRGSKTKTVGDFNSIGKQLYHISDDFNEIYKTLSAKIEDVTKELQPIATKYNGELKARIKDKASLNEKLASDPTFTPQNMSDVLGTRISVNSILDAKLLFSDISKKSQIILSDDFLDDVGRTLTHNTDYRAIHAQILTKDGFSFELQIRLKELDPLTEKSHALYKKTKYQKDTISADDLNKLLDEQDLINKRLSKKYFEIRDKELLKLKTNDPLDQPIPVGQRFDEDTGEIVTINKTSRELFEEEAKDKTMLERLKDCV